MSLLDPEANIWANEVLRMGEWRRLYNEGLNILYSSPNIVMVIKPT